MVPVLESFTATGASKGASAVAVELALGLNSIPKFLFIPLSPHYDQARIIPESFNYPE